MNIIYMVLPQQRISPLAGHSRLCAGTSGPTASSSVFSTSVPLYLEARDANYSNPDDFPVDYANRVWIFPIILTPLLWPAYVFDSPLLMAVQNLLLAESNIYLLITVMPVWRRMDIPSHPDEAESPRFSSYNAYYRAKQKVAK